MRGHSNVSVMGNLTAEPELRYTPDNTAVADMSIAVNEDEDTVHFFDVTAWGRTAENCSEYLDKGSPVFVDGRLKQDRWENNDGEKRTKVKIVANSVQFLSSGSKREQKEKGWDHKHDEQPEDDMPF